MQKKWPILAQVLIGLGCVGGIMSVVIGLSHNNWATVVLGAFSLSMFWFFYQKKPWAQKAVSAILAAIILNDLLSIASKEIPLYAGLLAIAFRGLILYYFNSKEINELFEEDSSS